MRSEKDGIGLLAKLEYLERGFNISYKNRKMREKKEICYTNRVSN